MVKFKSIISMFVIIIFIMIVKYHFLDDVVDDSDLTEIDVNKNILSYCTKEASGDDTVQAICIENQNIAFEKIASLSMSLNTLSPAEVERFNNIMQRCILIEEIRSGGVVMNWVGVNECYNLATQKEENSQ